MVVFLLSSFVSMEVSAAQPDIGVPIEKLKWDEVNKLLPKFSKFKVLDTETGRIFDVQRRAGSHHADVQPLTPKDTKTMKEIYNGKWSWKRRSIIVISDNKWVAASMHGMPHGAGALPNNFPGHFCIHFYGSTTHRTNHMDLSHKLMIFKAAGELHEYLYDSNPDAVVRAYIAGLKQHDAVILQAVSLQTFNAEKTFKQIENVKISRLGKKKVSADELVMQLPIEVEWFIKDRGRKAVSGNITVVRFSPDGPWFVDHHHFMKKNGLRVKN